jgi:2-octaprenyl-6-methoxyphenol hydroxylase
MTETRSVDVAIAGGGMVGLTLAIALADAGFAVALVDALPAETRAAVAYDGRSSAIAAGSKRVLETLGLWPAMAAAASPILDIRVSDARVGEAAASLFLHYDHRDLATKDGAAEPLGYIVENRAIRRALIEAVRARPALAHLAPASVVGFVAKPGRITLALADGGAIEATLAVAADGRDSPLRLAAGIRLAAWDYPQTGIVCTIGHALPHGGVAHEHFLPSGPFAVLPMVDDEHGHRSSIVWTERRERAPAILALDDAAFSAEIERRFGPSLGRIRIIGGRWAYPLRLQHAERYVAPRLALVGDAAHAIHPIAGQGLNLGLRDVAALAEALVDAKRLGLDVGEGMPLERYERWRRVDNLLLAASTDLLNRLFSNDLGPLRLVRDLGLAAVNRAVPVKRFLMRHAMGLAGDLPRLARGEPL